MGQKHPLSDIAISGAIAGVGFISSLTPCPPRKYLGQELQSFLFGISSAEMYSTIGMPLTKVRVYPAYRGLSNAGTGNVSVALIYNTHQPCFILPIDLL